MDYLLNMLIHQLRTLDGRKGSAEKILQALNQESFKEHMNKTGKPFISDAMRHHINLKNEHKIFRKVYIKYLIIRVRSKISFMAL